MTIEKHKSYSYVGETVHCIESDPINRMAYVGRINEHGILWYCFWTEWHTLKELENKKLRVSSGYVAI